MSGTTFVGSESPSPATLAGAAWSAIVVGMVARNSLLVDLLLVACYFVLYAGFWLLASRFARGIAGRLSPSVASSERRAGLFSLLFTVLLSLCFLVLLQWYLPARGLSAAGVGLIVSAVAVAVAGSLWVATRIPNPRSPGSMWLNVATVGLLGFLIVATSSASRTRFGQPLPVASPLVHADAQPAGRGSVLLVGVDGLDWVVFNDLVDEGRLPHLGRLVGEGVVAPLATFSAKSPLVWTSIVTGVAPEAHGVRDFVAPYLSGSEVLLPHSRFDFLGKFGARTVPYRDLRPFSSADRIARAIWEIASLLERRVLVVNWWATYPAEAVNGGLVSDYAFPSEVLDRDQLERMASYRRLATPEEAQRKALQTMRAVIGDRTVRVSSNPELPATERNEFFVVRDELAWSVFHALESPDVQLKLLYLNGVDAGSHVFSYEVFGDNRNEVRSPRVSEGEVKRLWDTLVTASYERLDAAVGNVLERLGENDLLLVASDHGWRYDGTGHWERPDGVLLLRGAGIRRGYQLSGASVYDVFPTLCYVLGLPLSAELQGEVLWDAFEPDSIRRSTLPTVESYGSRSDPGLPFPIRLDRDHLERLRSLGYIE